MSSASASDPYAAVRAVCRHHAKSFYFASHFLPKDKRRHAYAVYALCRRLDDAVDEAPDVGAACGAVADFGRLLDGVYDDKPLDDPVAEAARQTLSTCDIARTLFDDLAAGVETDLTVSRYADWPTLEQYCYLVAGVVGLMMCGVFGVTDPAAKQHAIAMGNAMQLTNILRDVKEDWRRGRLYLPADELLRFGITENDVDAFSHGRAVNDEWRRFCSFQVGRARSLYGEGFAGLGYIPLDGTRQTAAIMAVVYGGILDAIEAADFDVFTERRRLSLWQKLRRVPGGLRLARRTQEFDSATSRFS
ncbi:MAG: phytoene/squalene synthase family protein [Planctomycetota bacterium]